MTLQVRGESAARWGKKKLSAGEQGIRIGMYCNITGQCPALATQDRARIIAWSGLSCRTANNFFLSVWCLIGTWIFAGSRGLPLWSLLFSSWNFQRVDGHLLWRLHAFWLGICIIFLSVCGCNGTIIGYMPLGGCMHYCLRVGLINELI